MILELEQKGQEKICFGRACKMSSWQNQSQNQALDFGNEIPVCGYFAFLPDKEQLELRGRSK